VITWQAGTMLHPGAQAKAEHRKTPPRAPATPMHAVMAATRQSGHQQSAQSRHHPGASFSLARRHYSNTITNHKNNLTPVSIFRGEDHSDDAKRTSRLDPFFDAVVCGADEATQRIIAASRATWHQGREYEDDFCYARTLHACWSGHHDDAERQWARWRSVSGGGESRFVVCTALLARNAADLTDAVVLLLDEILAAIRERQAAESGDPDAAVTTDRLSLEGLALLRLAHRRGVPLSLSHVLLPDLLQLPPTVRLPDATAWRQVDDPRGLG